MRASRRPEAISFVAAARSLREPGLRQVENQPMVNMRLRLWRKEKEGRRQEKDGVQLGGCQIPRAPRPVLRPRSSRDDRKRTGVRFYQRQDGSLGFPAERAAEVGVTADEVDKGRGQASGQASLPEGGDEVARTFEGWHT